MHLSVSTLVRSNHRTVQVARKVGNRFRVGIWKGTVEPVVPWGICRSCGPRAVGVEAVVGNYKDDALRDKVVRLGNTLCFFPHIWSQIGDHDDRVVFPWRSKGEAPAENVVEDGAILPFQAGLARVNLHQMAKKWAFNVINRPYKMGTLM